MSSSPKLTPIDRSRTAMTLHTKPLLGPQQWPSKSKPIWHGQPNYTTGPGWQPVRPGATDYQRYPSLGATAKAQ